MERRSLPALNSSGGTGPPWQATTSGARPCIGLSTNKHASIEMVLHPSRLYRPWMPLYTSLLRALLQIVVFAANVHLFILLQEVFRKSFLPPMASPMRCSSYSLSLQKAQHSLSHSSQLELVPDRSRIRWLTPHQTVTAADHQQQNKEVA